jgi:hypothetical protein
MRHQIKEIGHEETQTSDKPGANRRIFRSVKQFVTAACFASIAGAAVWAAQPEQAPSAAPPALVVPGYGPGIAAHVLEGPVIGPLAAIPCRVNVPCTKPFTNASVLILDRISWETVGVAVTNASGNLLVTVPPGTYVVHVETVRVFPRCPEVRVTVGQVDFTPVQISCNTGLL